MKNFINTVAVMTIFLAGVVAALNLAVLYPNPLYDAALWKVFFAVTIAVSFGAYMATGGTQD